MDFTEFIIKIEEGVSLGQGEETTAVEESSSASARVSHRSKVWDYFVKLGNGQLAKCKLCDRVVSRGKIIGHLTNTGMNQHMRVHHKQVLLREENVVAPVQSSTRGSTSSTTTTSSRQSREQRDGVDVSQLIHSTQPPVDQFGSFHSREISQQQSKEITRLIAQLIAVGDAPFNMVEGEPFRQLMQALAPQYIVPSCITFSQTVVPSLYRACVEVLKEELRKADGQSVHFTTELWNAPSGQYAFLSLTAHWWQPNVSEGIPPPSGAGRFPAVTSGVVKQGHRSYLLHVEVMDEQHTSDNILQAVQKIVAQWIGEQEDGKAKLGFVVTDGTANMMKALHDGRYVGVRCSAHILHLVVRAAFDGESSSGRLAALLDSCQKIAGHFHNSVKDGHLPEQRKAGLMEHLVKPDQGTRWNSTLVMLECVLEQQKAINSMPYQQDIGLERPLSREDWAIISQVVAVLKPFRAVAENLSQENASIAQVIPLFTHLHNILEGFLSYQEVLPGGPLPEVVALITRLRDHLVRCIQDMKDTCPELMLASMCDPRIKDKMAVCYNALTTWRDKLIERVCDRERKINVPLEGIKEEEEEVECQSVALSSCASTAQPSGAAVFWAEALDSLVGPSRVPPRKCNSAQDMVWAYLSEPPLHPTVDPLEFWQDKKDMWPALSQVAQELLSCPPTTVQNERVFSVTGNILSPEQSQLDPLLMEQMAFLKINLPKLQYPALNLGID